ncbi:MAG: hypothetical protein K5669_04905 [Lachnospiraceae bacterium]|nr:hypothetical protein [Lachnospiraceae bacterium]
MKFGKHFKIVTAILLAVTMLSFSGCGMIISELLSDDEFWSDDYGMPSDGGHSGHAPSGFGNNDGGIISAGSLGGTALSSSLLESGAVREHGVTLKGNGEDTVTILVYMNGSNLESESGQGTTDIAEMVKAGSSDKVNILVQTMGTRTWHNYGIASNRSQIYKVDGSGPKLVKDDLGQLDCTSPDSLSSFIAWGAANYPADRYMLIFWNHGGGPVYGFGSDEWNSNEYASLTIDEMQKALSRGGVYFDFIGMDCCIMSCIEVCAALYDYCDYTILSEDFESGLGWYYTPWLNALYNNTSISTPELGKEIADTMVKANASNSYEGDESIMAVIDESMLKVLWQAWTDFAYANEEALLGSNYSREVTRQDGGRIHPLIKNRPSATRFGGGWDDFSYSDYYSEDDTEMSDYYVTDIMAVASNIDTTESEVLKSALNSAIVYMSATSGDSDLTGISVTLPYGDEVFYADLRTIFTNCGFDSEYITWLKKFITASGTGNYYDYSSWEEDWQGWEDYNDDYNWNDWDYSGEDNYDYWCDWGDWGSFGNSDSCYDYDYYSDEDYYGYYDDYCYDDGGYYYGDDYYSYDDYYDDGYYDYGDVYEDFYGYDNWGYDNFFDWGW